jgi:serine-type D-Ala-D-Ala carboxypeptidase/endopeptidase
MTLGRRFGVAVVCLVVGGSAVGGNALRAQTPAVKKVAGDYLGQLGSLHLKLHIEISPGNDVLCSIDSPDQGAKGIPCSNVDVGEGSLSFTVPAVHGTWKGTVSADGKILTGVWDQGSPMPLVFTRDTFVAATKPSRVDGIWLGTLKAGDSLLRTQVHLRSDDKGKEYCSFDSLDQHAMGIECSNVVLSGDDFSFDLPAVKGHYAAKLSADGNTLTGTWSQGGPTLPLTFTRQATEIGAAPVKPPTYDAAMAPVTAAELQAVMDKDLAKALKDGQLAASTGGGITIGVVEHGVRRVFSYGSAKTDSIFEIGSMTKTFTGLILSQMVEQGKVQFDEPVRALLPAGTVAKPAGAEITLLDLATQHSSLPRMPDNFHPADENNPYADYGAANLYAFLKEHGVAKPATTSFLYSNLGFGLLGQALADRAGTAYPELLKAQVTGPLGVRDTVVTLSPEQQGRFISGHSGEHKPAHAWDLVALAGAGAIRSTAGDMLTYLEANLHPETVKPAAGFAGSKTLSAALVQDHELRADAVAGMRIALAWLYEPDKGNYWHNGATGGYSSYGCFNPKGDYAAVVLYNTSISDRGSFADMVGEHISERLAGKPAISLGD